jgi:hypothetical protein
MGPFWGWLFLYSVLADKFGNSDLGDAPFIATCKIGCLKTAFGIKTTAGRKAKSRQTYLYYTVIGAFLIRARVIHLIVKTGSAPIY